MKIRSKGIRELERENSERERGFRFTKREKRARRFSQKKVNNRGGLKMLKVTNTRGRDRGVKRSEEDIIILIIEIKFSLKKRERDTRFKRREKIKNRGRSGSDRFTFKEETGSGVRERESS